jgi:hypothetical protein
MNALGKALNKLARNFITAFLPLPRPLVDSTWEAMAAKWRQIGAIV